MDFINSNAEKFPDMFTGEQMDLTKYEIARIIGARALQLSLGAPPLIKVTVNNTTFIQIAEIELDKGIIPLRVTREN